MPKMGAAQLSQGKYACHRGLCRAGHDAASVHDHRVAVAKLILEIDKVKGDYGVTTCIFLSKLDVLTDYQIALNLVMAYPLACTLNLEMLMYLRQNLILEHDIQ